MIYVSSSCVKKTSISAAVEELARNGFTAIELSGGTHYYDNYLDDLLRLKKEYNLSYLIHNYFPPPRKAFVLNLASLDDTIFRQSFEHCKRAIETCRLLGSPVYGIHAGFFINIQVREIGKPLSKDNLYDKELCIKRFCSAFKELQGFAGTDVNLFIENNVISSTNYSTFEGINPLMCTNSADISDLKNELEFNLILDVAHLKVSCNTLGLSFEKQLNELFLISDYIHISDNDGMTDSNAPLQKHSKLLDQLSNLDFSNKIITLEIYDSLPAISSSYELIQSIINA